MRIALFGGSFDPPHLGHVAIARAAAEEFRLDAILFAPAGRQPLKRDGHSASFEQRLTMADLTCGDADPAHFFPSAIDAPEPDGSPNYTVDTLEALADQYPEAELFNLAGADSFQLLAKWREPYRVLALAQWIVVSRPGVPLAIPAGLELTPAQRARIHLLDSVHEDVAATNLRERLAQGDPCTDLLTPSVAAYIAEHHLYEAGAGDREIQRSDS
jgi:nicotinate-nucleotide adenylyltransferase